MNQKEINKFVEDHVLGQWLNAIKRHSDADKIYTDFTEHCTMPVGKISFERQTVKSDSVVPIVADSILVTITINPKDCQYDGEEYTYKMELPLMPLEVSKGIIVRPIKTCVYTDKWYGNKVVPSPYALYKTLCKQFSRTRQSVVGYFMAAKINGVVYKTRVYCVPDDYNTYSKKRAMYLLNYKLNKMLHDNEARTDTHMYDAPKTESSWCSYCFIIPYSDQVVAFNRQCKRYFKETLINTINRTVQKIKNVF